MGLCTLSTSEYKSNDAIYDLCVWFLLPSVIVLFYFDYFYYEIFYFSCWYALINMFFFDVLSPEPK